MNRRSLRGGLAVSLAAVLLLPIVVAVTVGTAALLAAVGDLPASGVLRWVALAVGVLWVVSVVITAAVSAAVTLADGGRRRGGKGGGNGRQLLREEAGPPA